jgi:hypothetical protein
MVTGFTDIQPVDERVNVMFAIPPLMPVTTPEASTVAMPVLDDDHVPLPDEQARVVVAPWHILVVPVRATGAATTVTTEVAVQPVEERVKLITAVPELMPVTTPVEALTVATLVLLLLHVPVPEELLNVVVRPGHTVKVPVLAEGAITVTTLVALQMLPTE